MGNPQEQFEQLIQHLQSLIGHELSIMDNACTLVDDNNDTAAVIELPEGSDLLLLHGMVSRLSSDPDTRNGRALQLLTLNGSPDKLKGAWLSIDPEGYGIYLMTSSPIGVLTPGLFENWLLNYIQLADHLKTELKQEEQPLSHNQLSSASGLQI